jgi:hypothetical protein
VAKHVNLNDVVAEYVRRLTKELSESATGTGDARALNVLGTVGAAPSYMLITNKAAEEANLSSRYSEFPSNGFTATPNIAHAVISSYAAGPKAVCEDLVEYLAAHAHLADSDPVYAEAISRTKEGPAMLIKHLDSWEADGRIATIQFSNTWNCSVGIWRYNNATVDLKNNQARIFFKDTAPGAPEQDWDSFIPGVDLTCRKKDLFPYCKDNVPAACEAFGTYFDAEELKNASPEAFPIYEYLCKGGVKPKVQVPFDKVLIMHSPCEAFCKHNWLMVEHGMPFIVPYDISKGLRMKNGLGDVEPLVVPMFSGCPDGCAYGGPCPHTSLFLEPDQPCPVLPLGRLEDYFPIDIEPSDPDFLAWRNGPAWPASPVYGLVNGGANQALGNAEGGDYPAGANAAAAGTGILRQGSPTPSVEIVAMRNGPRVETIDLVSPPSSQGAAAAASSDDAEELSEVEEEIEYEETASEHEWDGVVPHYRVDCLLDGCGRCIVLSRPDSSTGAAGACAAAGVDEGCEIDSAAFTGTAAAGGSSPDSMEGAAVEQPAAEYQVLCLPELAAGPEAEMQEMFAVDAEGNLSIGMLFGQRLFNVL